MLLMNVKKSKVNSDFCISFLMLKIILITFMTDKIKPC
jgi:hypothetical protein